MADDRHLQRGGPARASAGGTGCALLGRHPALSVDSAAAGHAVARTAGSGRGGCGHAAPEAVRRDQFAGRAGVDAGGPR
ncbi:hypothetical protein G6F55_014686 [Rhizopus delemar]|nr:hypothetical protein G6F55_014686 [Rhizopus delemar]